MIITDITHPHLFNALRAVDLHEGGVAEPRKPCYEVPDFYTNWAGIAEQGLALLSKEDTETLCNGEADEKAAIAQRSTEVAAAGVMIAHYREYFSGGEWPCTLKNTGGSYTPPDEPRQTEDAPDGAPLTTRRLKPDDELFQYLKHVPHEVVGSMCDVATAAKQQVPSASDGACYTATVSCFVHGAFELMKQIYIGLDMDETTAALEAEKFIHTAVAGHVSKHIPDTAKH